MSERGSKSLLEKRVKNLSCVEQVDSLLMQAVPLTDVVKYIQQDRGELADIDSIQLAAALSARRRSKYAEMGWWGAVFDDEATPEPRMRLSAPGALAKTLYARVEGGIKDLLELEALYLTQRERVDRMIESEAQHGAFSEKTKEEILAAKEILGERRDWMKSLGLVGGLDAAAESEQKFKAYSQGTIDALRNPEARTRVVSLVDRLSKLGRLKAPLPDVELPSPDEK